MKKLQIIFGIAGILLGIYTMIVAVLFLNNIINDIGYCMIGMLLCLFINSISCMLSVLNLKKKEE